MDSPAPARLPAPRLLAPLPLVGLILLVAGYAWFLRQHIAPYAGGSDSSGYLNSAALLLQGQLSTPVRTLEGHAADAFGPLAHQPLGFVIREGTNLMIPSYPIGLPLHLMVFSWLVGLDWAAIPLNICSALAGGGLMYLFARRLGLPRPLALGGSMLLLLCPLYLHAAMQPMSDLLALVWAMAALYAALRAREGRRWAAACGVAIACAVLVRPTNLLLVVPVAVALGVNWRAGLWVGLGGLPGALLLAAYNREVYGSPFITGYGAIWSAFSPEYVPHNLAHFARWIPGLLSPLVLAALAVPFLRATRSREFAVLGTWALLLIGLYGFYYHSGETWWYLRFILPAFPVLLLAALAALHSLAPAAAWRGLVGGLLVTAGLAWEAGLAHRLVLTNIKSAEATYPETAAWARIHLPADSAVFCFQVSGAFHYYTDFLLVRWDLVQPAEMIRLLQVLHEQHRPVHAVLYDFEEQRARQRLGGTWTKLTRIRQATVWRVDPAPVVP